MLELYGTVVVKNDNYRAAYGIPKGAVGTVVERWDHAYAEVTFSYSNGVDYAQATMRFDDLESADPEHISLPNAPL